MLSQPENQSTKQTSIISAQLERVAIESQGTPENQQKMKETIDRLDDELKELLTLSS